MAIDGELDYDKIRNAMDKVSAALYKKEENDLKNTKKEQIDSEEKTKQEKKDNLFKWVTYGAVIFIAVVIIIIIIVLIVTSFQKSSNNNIQQQPVFKPIQQQPVFKPFQLFPPVQQPQMQPLMQPLMPRMQPQMQPQMPQMQPLMPQKPVIIPQQPQMQPQQQMQQQLNSSSPPYQLNNNNTDISSFNFPSTNASFFNKLDYNSSSYQQPIKRGGRKNKN